MAKEDKIPLVEEQGKQDIVDKPSYSKKEELYLSGLQKKMEQARNQRDQDHDEFDGMSYISYYNLNESFANTFIQPKQNKEDTNFQSGTVRQKVFALLSALENLNLAGDISAYDKEGLRIQGLGDAMEDIMLKTNELDGDEEKKYIRHYELLKHGTVFVEEIWDERWKKVKRMKDKFKGSIKDTEWKTKIQKAFARPSRNVLPGTNVYLGDITKYSIIEQPFIFTVEHIPYAEAKTIFEKWDRWENVPRSLQEFSAGEQRGIYDTNWRLWDTKKNYVEILRYQDKWENEFAILLNGVLMTPIGMPFPWGYEEYNIVQQNLEPIHAKFSYGKSLVARIRNKIALMDELMRMAILKTQKSFMPPYLNNSGRILSNRVFMPGKITYGIQPGTLTPLSEHEVQGVTQAEMSMIKEIQESVNAETVSPTFQGQQAKGNPTATEIIELQRQARMILGLTVLSVSLLEWKLEWLRLKNILANWFHPEDEVVDEMRKEIRNRYRQVSVERTIEGEGMGRRIVISTKEIPSPESITQTEDLLSEEQGIPIRLIFLNPEEVTKTSLIWQIVVKPKEKKTSETNKLMFRAFLQDVIPFNPNLAYLQERIASVWEENPQKLFEQNPQQALPAGAEQQQGGGQTLSPRVNLPSPEGAATREVQSALKA